MRNWPAPSGRLRAPAHEGRVQAICDDYRASAFLDAERDKQDQQNGRQLTIPVLAAWRGFRRVRGPGPDLHILDRGRVRTFGPNATVHWEFKIPGAAVDTTVTCFEPGRRLAFLWSDETSVDCRFVEHKLGTMVEIENAGFSGSDADAIEAALGAVQGFAIVVCDLKSFLENGRPAHFSRDKAMIIAEEQQRIEESG